MAEQLMKVYVTEDAPITPSIPNSIYFVKSPESIEVFISDRFGNVIRDVLTSGSVSDLLETAIVGEPGSPADQELIDSISSAVGSGDGTGNGMISVGTMGELNDLSIENNGLVYVKDGESGNPEIYFGDSGSGEFTLLYNMGTNASTDDIAFMTEDHDNHMITYPDSPMASGNTPNNYFTCTTAELKVPDGRKTQISMDVEFTYIAGDFSMSHTSVKVSGHLNDEGWVNNGSAQTINLKGTQHIRVYLGATEDGNYALICRTDTPDNCEFIQARLSNIMFKSSEAGIEGLHKWSVKMTDSLLTGVRIHTTIDVLPDQTGSTPTAGQIVLPANLLHSSGRFLHGNGPYDVGLGIDGLNAIFDPQPVFGEFNRSSFQGYPGPLHQSGDAGGYSDIMKEEGLSLAKAMGIEASLWNVSFNLCQIDAGDDEDSTKILPHFLHDSLGEKTFAQNFKLLPVSGEYTAAYWVRALRGEVVVRATHKNGNDLGGVSEVIVKGSDRWVHIRLSEVSLGTASPFSLFMPHSGNTGLIGSAYLANGNVEITPMNHTGIIPGTWPN